MDQAQKLRVADGKACLEAALQYREMFHWSVLALCPPDHVGMRLVSKGHTKSCPSPGKVPWYPWKEYIDRLATEAEVREWWRRLPNSNVGGVLGEVSCLIRVDVEGASGERLLRERAGGNLPETVEFRSGRSDGTGRGLLFAIPSGVALRTTFEAVEAGAELRFQARGAQTVLPPSRHKDGGLYEWVSGHSPFDGKPATAPPWLVQELSPKGNGESSGRLPGEWEEIFAGVPQGARNSSMASVIGKLLHGLGDLDAAGDVQAVWLSVKAINAGNSPPLDEEELQTIFRSIHGRERQRRERENQEALNRLVVRQIEESCDKAPPEKPAPVNGNGALKPAWLLKIRQSDPVKNYLRSPLWSDRPRVHDNGGFVQLSTNQLCHWSKIIEAVAEQAGWRIPNKLKDWPTLLNRLYENAIIETAPDEEQRPLLLLHFLWEKLRAARPMNKEEDGVTLVWGHGHPEIMPDGSIIVKLEWLQREGMGAAEFFKPQEVLEAVQKARMVPHVMGPKTSRRRWWVLPAAQVPILQSLVTPEDKSENASENGCARCAPVCAQNQGGAHPLEPDGTRT